MDILQPILVELARYVALAILALLLVFVKKGLDYGVAYLKQKIGEAQFNRIRDFVGTAVRFVEQSPEYKTMLGQAKKEYVVSAAVAFCEKIGVEPDYEMIDKFIEEAVELMNEIIKPQTILATSELKESQG